MPDFRPVLALLGIFLALLGVSMFIPAVLDLDMKEKAGEWHVFAVCGAMTTFIGGLLYLANRQKHLSLSIRQAFLLTTLSWVSISAFGALPFVFSSLDLSFTKAFFETASGLTTTGSTVIVGLDHLPRDILLWRSMLTGLGGVGIVGMGLTVLPMLRVGGMQLFKTESSDKSDKIFPRQSQVAIAVTIVYVFLVLLCAFWYWVAGMSGFDAITHAMPTVATAGFANYDMSFGHFDSAKILWVSTIFMYLGSLPLLLLIHFAKNPEEAWHKSSQVRYYTLFFIVTVSILSVYMVFIKDYGVSRAVTMSAFHVASIVTTTGFMGEDYLLWGAFPIALFFVLTFVGGCSGSTSGAIKFFRIQILWLVVKRQLHELVYPSGVYIPKYDRRPLDEATIRSVLSFVFVYVLTFIILALGLALCGLDFQTAFSGSATVLGNVGPGIGNIIGPAGNFSTLGDMPLWLLSTGMILGRLELFTVFVLFTPMFWRS